VRYNCRRPVIDLSELSLTKPINGKGACVYKKISEDISQEYYQQNFQNDGQRFVAWYLRNIHLRDLIQARDDITDGPDDKQIDAVFVDDD
jgi:hypothetical protein